MVTEASMGQLRGPPPSRVAPRPLLPPPNRNRLLPISITLLSGRNPRIRGFGWGRVGAGGRAAGHSLAPPLDPHPRPLPTRRRGVERRTWAKGGTCTHSLTA